jgi:hypothetical protein
VAPGDSNPKPVVQDIATTKILVMPTFVSDMTFMVLGAFAKLLVNRRNDSLTITHSSEPILLPLTKTDPRCLLSHGKDLLLHSLPFFMIH